MLTDRLIWLPCVPMPYILQISEKVKFKHVSCGSHHSVAVSVDGNVYGCGLSSNGRLGFSLGQGVSNVFEFTKVPQYNSIHQAHCGRDFTILLTDEGELLTTGKGENGINCNFENQSFNCDRESFLKLPNSFFGGQAIKFVSAGLDHAAAINTKGELWMWGLN